MDGRFVPNLTIGPPVIRKIRKVSGLPFDVHLMIEDPIRYVEAFRDAGADYITVHVEASDGVGKTLEKIHAVGAKAGITLRPKTPVSTLEPFLQKVDLVLVMTVEPGFGGQAFMPDMLDKIEWVRTRFSGLISVDGGINLATGGLAVSKGADVLVIGSAIFKKTDRKNFFFRFRPSFLFFPLF